MAGLCISTVLLMLAFNNISKMDEYISFFMVGLHALLGMGLFLVFFMTEGGPLTGYAVTGICNGTVLLWLAVNNETKKVPPLNTETPLRRPSARLEAAAAWRENNNGTSTPSPKASPVAAQAPLIALHSLLGLGLWPVLFFVEGGSMYGFVQDGFSVKGGASVVDSVLAGRVAAVGCLCIATVLLMLAVWNFGSATLTEAPAIKRRISQPSITTNSMAKQETPSPARENQPANTTNMIMAKHQLKATSMEIRQDPQMCN